MSVEDKQEIYEVVLRYCRGVDRADLELVRSSYHCDAIDHHAGFDGPIDDFITWLAPTIDRYDGLMHIVGNHMITINGDKAVSETYAMGIHWGGAADDERNFTSGLRYVDQMERRDGRWAIAERWAVREWVRSEVRHFKPLGDVPKGQRGDNDAVFKALRWLES